MGMGTDGPLVAVVAFWGRGLGLVRWLGCGVIFLF